jgi:hypothetical protein
VKVRLASDAQEFRVKLNDKAVTGLFRRTGTLRRATIPRRLLRRGPNHLEVITSDSSGRDGYDVTRFVAGRASTGLLSVRAPARAKSSIPVALRLRKRPDLMFRVRLNGRAVTRVFEQRGWAKRRARLGADDGLRFGRNVLAVVVARKGGAYDVEKRVVTVRRGAPLAGLAAPRRTEAGLPVWLSTKGSRTAGRAGKLSFSWKVLKRPKGSQPAFRKPAGGRRGGILFDPDKVGTYRISLTVRDGEGKGSDVVTLPNLPSLPPIGLPVDTKSQQGSGVPVQITIGQRSYQADSPVDLLAVVVDRNSFEVRSHDSYSWTAAGASSLLGDVKGQGSDRLVIVSRPVGPIAPQWQSVVKALGAPAIPGLDQGRGTFSVIGIPGVPGAGIANAGLQSEGALTGYLQDNGALQAVFVPGGRPTFDTAAEALVLQNTIRVGSQEVPSGPLPNCSAGGFQVARFGAEDLEFIDSETFSTNGCGQSADEQGQAEMAAHLTVSASDFEPKLYLVQSIGSARGTNDGDWPTLARAIANVGGTPATFGSATGQYALVGAINAPGFQFAEQSSSLTGAPGRISGVLKPGALGAMQPAGSVPGPASGVDLHAVAYQQGQEWPFSQTSGEQAAIRYAAEALESQQDYPAPSAGSSCYVPPGGAGDVRSEYCNLSLLSEFATFATFLEGLDHEAGYGFTPTDLANVTGQLAAEMRMLPQLWSSVGEMAKVYGGKNLQQATIQLDSIAGKIESDLVRSGAGDVAGVWEGYVGDLLNLTSFFAEDIATPVGVLSGALYVGADVATESSGDPVPNRFQVATSDFATDLADFYFRASAEVSHLGNLLVTDWGKLSFFNDNRSDYEFTTTTLSGIADDVASNSRGWAYRSLMPAAYEAFQLEETISLNDPLPQNANDYLCTLPLSEGGGNYRPFDAPANAQYHLTDLGEPILLVMVEQGSNPPDVDPSDSGSALDSPPAAVIDAVFADPSTAGGGGQFRPWFWRHGLGFGDPAAPPLTTVRCRAD